MSAQEIDVQPVKVIYVCDKCMQAEMEPVDNQCLTSSPPRYRYKCPHCGDKQTLSCRYPHIHYREIKDER